MISVLSGNGPLLVGPIPLDQRVNLANCVVNYNFADPDCFNGGATITDLMGNVNNTVQGTMTLTTNKQRVGNTTTTAWAKSLQNAVLNYGSGNFTVELWVSSSLATSAPAILDMRPLSTDGSFYAMFFTNTGSAIFYWLMGNRITATSVISANRFHHVVVSRIGTTITMYVNGAAAGSPYTSAGSPSANPRIVIARNGFNESSAPAAKYGAIRIYNRGLTAAEVLKNYNLERIYYI
jgi:hypothetical protein